MDDMQNLTPDEGDALDRAMDRIMAAKPCLYCHGPHSLAKCEQVLWDRSLNNDL